MKLLWLGVDVSRVLHLAAVFCLTCVLLKAIQLFHRRRELLRALADFPGHPVHWLFGHVHEVGESRVCAAGSEGECGEQLSRGPCGNDASGTCPRGPGELLLPVRAVGERWASLFSARPMCFRCP